MSQECTVCGISYENLINEGGLMVCTGCKEPEPTEEDKKAQPNKEVVMNEVQKQIADFGKNIVAVLANKKAKKGDYKVVIEDTVEFLREVYKATKTIKPPVSRAQARTEEPTPEKKEKPESLENARPCKGCSQTGKIKTRGGYRKHYACNGCGWITKEMLKDQVDYWTRHGKNEAEVNEIISAL